LSHYLAWNAAPNYCQLTHISDYLQDGNDADFISWDLGIITNTGQRTENSDDDILQVKVVTMTYYRELQGHLMLSTSNALMCLACWEALKKLGV